MARNTMLEISADRGLIYALGTVALIALLLAGGYFFVWPALDFNGTAIDNASPLTKLNASNATANATSQNITDDAFLQLALEAEQNASAWANKANETADFARRGNSVPLAYEALRQADFSSQNATAAIGLAKQAKDKVAAEQIWNRANSYTSKTSSAISIASTLISDENARKVAAQKAAEAAAEQAKVNATADAKSVNATTQSLQVAGTYAPLDMNDEESSSPAAGSSAPAQTQTTTTAAPSTSAGTYSAMNMDDNEE